MRETGAHMHQSIKLAWAGEKTRVCVRLRVCVQHGATNVMSRGRQLTDGNNNTYTRVVVRQRHDNDDPNATTKPSSREAV